MCSPVVASTATLVSQPGVTCGLCGGIVAVSEPPRCEACGEQIRDAADGVKLCDGTIVHVLCRRPGAGRILTS